MRDKLQSSFWIYGRHAVIAALQNPKRCKIKLFYTATTPPEEARKFSLNHLSDQPKNSNFKGRKLPCDKISPSALQQMLGNFAIHQGLALQVTPLVTMRAEDFIVNTLNDKTCEKLQILVLDRLEDLQNVGAIIRSASLLGADAVITDRWRENAHLARAAAGALETIPLLECGNIARFIDWLKQRDIWTIGLDMTGKNLKAISAPKYTALIIGTEGKGLHRLIREKCDFLCRIAMNGQQAYGPESLNVSVSTALALHHLLDTQ